MLRWALGRPAVIIVATLAVAALSVLLFTQLETGFLPEMDEGGYIVDYWTPEGTSLPETDRMLKRLEAVLQATPEVASFARRTGAELGMFATAQNTGDIVVRLKPRSERSRTAEEVVEAQRAIFAKEMPGMTIEFVMLLQDMLGDLEGSPEPVEVKIFGDDLTTLESLAARTSKTLEKIPGLVDIVVPQRGNPELSLHVDPTRASKAGLTVAQITSQLTSGLLGQQATSFRRNDRLIDVRVRFPDRQRFDLGWLREFPLTTEAGTLVPLSAVATVDTAEGATELHREDLRQMIPITGRLEGRDLGSGIRDVQAALAGQQWPIGYSWQLGGQYESQQGSFRSMLLVLSVAVLLVFGVLVAQFRRFLPAIIILSAAPLSLAGAFGLLLLTGTPLNVSSMMGLILLIGLIVKNGIILVDYADIVAARGDDGVEALVEAGAVRLRPILMTTLVHAVRARAARPRARPRRGDAEAPGDRGHRRTDTCRRSSRCCSCRWRSRSFGTAAVAGKRPTRARKVGRDAGIRTRDLLHPKQARYQAALHPEKAGRSRRAGHSLTAVSARRRLGVRPRPIGSGAGASSPLTPALGGDTERPGSADSISSSERSASRTPLIRSRMSADTDPGFDTGSS